MGTFHPFRVAALVIAAAAALCSACSKNEAATSACSSSTDSESCNSCCTKNGASGYKYISTCACLGGSGKPVAAAPVSAGTTSFTGTYSSTFGQAVFTQSGDHVNVKYARGTMICTAAGNALDCDWDEGHGMKGRAKLVKETGGTIRGTWGNGPSATDGGAWVFTP